MSSYVAMAAVSGHGHPIGALNRLHSPNRDITGSEKSSPPADIGQ